MRSVKTDFVSCPSCGRTLFDLQEVTEQIKQKTGHLPGVAIAIMVRTVSQSVAELIYSSIQFPLHLTATFHRVQLHFMRLARQQQLAVSIPIVRAAHYSFHLFSAEREEASSSELLAPSLTTRDNTTQRNDAFT
jgi:GcpE protein